MRNLTDTVSVTSCNSCGYSPKHCTCGNSPQAILLVFKQSIREKTFRHQISTTKKVYIPAGMVTEPRRGKGWQVTSARSRA